LGENPNHPNMTWSFWSLVPIKDPSKNHLNRTKDATTQEIPMCHQNSNDILHRYTDTEKKIQNSLGSIKEYINSNYTTELY
jgi:hypothetical protein